MINENTPTAPKKGINIWQQALIAHQDNHLSRAIELYQQVITQNPQFADAYANLAMALSFNGQREEAVLCYPVAYPLEPTRLEILSDWIFALKKKCRWSVQDCITTTLLQASIHELDQDKVSPINPFVACFLPLSLSEFQAVCASHAQFISKSVEKENCHFDHSSHDRSAPQKIKIGYVCAGFLNHPTGQLTEGMFQRHDRTKFEIYGYATDALWAQVPVLTLRGKTFSSSVCASLLTAVGLPELICSTTQEFIDKAVYLAQNPLELQKLHDRLQENKYHLPLFDTDTWVQSFEDALKIIFDRFLSSQPMKPINLKQI